MSTCLHIPKGSEYHFGSGGSKTVIIITPNKEVYKLFPIIATINDPKNNLKNLKRCFFRYLFRSQGIY